MVTQTPSYLCVAVKGKNCFTSLNCDRLDVPSVFNFPFNHEPNEVSLLAAEELKKELQTGVVKHNFDLTGKMFGVLVVQGSKGGLGFVKSYSGKLDNNTSPEGFVPPVFDVHHNAGFFKAEEKRIDGLTEEIRLLESSSQYLSLRVSVQEKQKQTQDELYNKKQLLLTKKEARKKQRALNKDLLSAEKYQSLNNALNEQSKKEQLVYKKEKRLLGKELKSLEDAFEKEENKIKKKKKERSELSSRVQYKIFESYSFLNSKKEEKNLIELFEKTAFKLPPSGAGECCAPRLLQYAYIQNLRPVCFTEFWWGASPDSEIRVHGQHYPACRGKCGPILQHMLKGLSVDDDPLKNNKEISELKIIFEDDVVLAIEKPADILSVPGKEIKHSLASLLKRQFPNIEGPGLVHRLDYETSGIILVAKTLDIYKALQKQFTSRTVKKKYVAILKRSISLDYGKIDLPLRGDLYNRPRQLVCFEHGKKAETEFKVLGRTKNSVRVSFFPITGRTHQLRVHAAHKSGLNSPIIGDSLYGSSAERLFLHAEEIKFEHPVSGKTVTLISPVPF